MLTRRAARKSVRNLLLLFPLLLYPYYSFAGNAAPSSHYQSLMSQYNSIKASLESNQYGVPVYIRSEFRKDVASGEVYALLNHDFATVAASLGSSDQWCDVVSLHINVKGCDVDAGNQSQDQLTIYVGRRHYQTPDEAHEMQYRFHKADSLPDYLHVNLTSGSGPYGTTEYLLTFEVIPFDDSSSFIHFKYSYHYGLMAKLAIEGYLATIGKNKVGFTVKDYDAENQPVYVQGLQGIVERNSMRYFIAIRAFLDASGMRGEQWENRVEQWYQLASGFERQFMEVRDREYIETKRKEYANRDAATKTALLRSN
ncbi:MAG: hypothetical protein L0Z73_15145 [Gammaproteobacteria bacterium]|nr:hypothetical protein [Gammaproteobacteria bacterium]